MRRELEQNAGCRLDLACRQARNGCIAVVVFSLALMGCQGIRDGRASSGSEENGKGDATAASAVTIEIPDGLTVAVDGVVKGTSPLGVLMLAPGEHEVTVTGPCGVAKAALDVKAGTPAELDAGDFEGLQVARLKIRASTLDGAALTPEVYLGEWRVPGDAREQTLVPACASRLRVAVEGLGAFIEDIDPSPGELHLRDVVLTPGPGVVRIHGGPFRIGPPGPDHYDPNFSDKLVPGEGAIGWPWIPTFAVEVGTFDIDRTEVTADQLHACYLAGVCKRDVLQWGATRTPRDDAACTTDPFDDRRGVTGGKGEHPANCVATWEAEKYCKWVGKRLPSDVEWEYAARSRKAEYACSWGGGFDMNDQCDRSKTRKIHPVCSFPEDDTEQGLCDMMGNVYELVKVANVPGRRDGRSEAVYKGFMAPFEEAPDFGNAVQSVDVGFRCARDVTGSPAKR